MTHEPQPFSFAGGDAISAADMPPSRPRASLYTWLGKRLLDIIAVLLVAPILCPVIVITCLLVARDGSWPLFGHRRIGKSGKIFRCWKIRSMVPDAEARLTAYLAQTPEARQEWELNFKLEHDPRITRMGRFLRRSSLDELPQLWNILIGDMSVVGPRPVTQKELVRYGAAATQYRAMRPGLTGLWQVSGRNDISYDERIGLDLEYMGKMGFFTDTHIILRTVLAVLGRTGR